MVENVHWYKNHRRVNWWRNVSIRSDRLAQNKKKTKIIFLAKSWTRQNRGRYSNIELYCPDTVRPVIDNVDGINQNVCLACRRIAPWWRGPQRCGTCGSRDVTSSPPARVNENRMNEKRKSFSTTYRTKDTRPTPWRRTVSERISVTNEFAIIIVLALYSWTIMIRAWYRRICDDELTA